MYRFRDGQPTVWFHRKRDDSNRYCLYCGEDLSAESVRSTKEHLIGREFVPTGTLEGTAFNFLFRSCEGCNSRKGHLERHVSTVTLYVSPARAGSARIDQLARRKALKDFHHKKRVQVSDAGERHTILANLGGVAGTFGLIAPPQLDPRMSAELACRQIQGFFSLLTSTNPTTLEETRLLPPERVFCDGAHHSRDWGSPRLLEVVRRVQSWRRLGVVTTAQGFFRAEFRRDEERTGQWFWALEWNKSTRILGVIASPGEPRSLFEDLPSVGWMPLGTGARIRVEVPLRDESADLLFRDE